MSLSRLGTRSQTHLDRPATAGRQVWREAISADRVQAALIALLAAGARLWLLGDKGLSYDESITAIASQAAPGEIFAFHWNTTFTHTPAWLLFMNAWTRLFGRSEAAVRLPAALAGILAVVLLWQLLKTWWPPARAVRVLAAVLTALSPLLVLYSQDARMYGLALLFGLGSIYAGTRLLAAPTTGRFAALVLINWAMLAFQYYFLLLLGIEGLFLLAVTWPRRRLCAGILAALVISALPILLWFVLAPGFRATVAVILVQAGQGGAGGGAPLAAQRAFLDSTWRDLTFGSIRWQPAQSVIGYSLLPLFLAGLVMIWRRRPSRAGAAAVPWGRFVIMIVLVPLLAGLALSGYMETRYFLFVAPFLYVCVAWATTVSWRVARALGASLLLIPLVVAGLGLNYYYRDYHKSEYREMARYVASHAEPGDAVVLEAPRQHLSAKYYLPPQLPLYTMPSITLPAYLPITAPPVVPERADHELDAIMKQHGHAWLVLAGEDEVDAGAFVEHYLAAIAYPVECQGWMNVRLCHYIAPTTVEPSPIPISATYAHELHLAGAAAAVSQRAADERYLLVRLDWQAERKPSVDYRVTLRLLDLQGKVIRQMDDLPIGPLLPPTTWNAGDRKPGYMALGLPRDLAPGAYRVALGVYNPETQKLFTPAGPVTDADGMVELAGVQVSGAAEIKISQ